MNPSTIHPGSGRPRPNPPACAGEAPVRSLVRSAAAPQRSRCRVCGFSEVRTDEVIDRGALLLAECPRCEYRWTESAPRPFVVRPPARRVGEVAPAA